MSTGNSPERGGATITLRNGEEGERERALTATLLLNLGVAGFVLLVSHVSFRTDSKIIQEGFGNPNPFKITHKNYE
jgi:hypothetical protein